ncbi:MAG TPA: hypothetical protein VHY91_17905 [Pirellulales bacterium]|jgi:hypothetical protein|nr:hypothetical protein [Pirellulales bacterium]
MQFRQQRRRRVWPDEVTQSGSESDDAARQAGADAAATGQPRETYTAQARREEQPRLTDLIPTRYRVIAAWYAAGALVIGLLEALHSRLGWMAEQVAPAVPRALDLAERGSFAAWFSSAWLSLTAVTSILLFSLRRHRVDDYRGRYRIWIWAALAWMALAVNQTAQWDDLMRAVVLNAGSRVGLNQDWLWPVLAGSVLLGCAARMTIEMRGSALSLALFWTGGLAWFAAVLCPWLAIAGLQPESQTMLVAGLTLAGQWTILWAHLTYARHVLLDAHGLLAPRVATTPARRVKRLRKTAAVREDSAHATVAESSPRGSASAGRPTNDLASPSAKVTTATKPAVAPAAAVPAKTAAPAKPVAAAGVRLGVHEDDDDDSDDDSSDRNLSRAERKRLKRLQRGQIRTAA